MATLLFIVGIILFIMLVVVHELGHAIVARRNGVVVEEFGIGFPPKAWGKKLKNGVLFTINWLPLGGFVRLKGESDDDKRKGSFGRASLWAKTKILMAGVGVNWLTSIVLFTILALSGMPKVLPNPAANVEQFTVPADTTVISQDAVLAQVVPGSPAANAGLQPGDTVVRFNGQPINSATDLPNLTQTNAGKTVEIAYERNGQPQQARVELRPANAEGGELGVVPIDQTLQRSTWSAPVVGVGLTAQLTWESLKGLGAALGNLATGLFQQLSFSQEAREQGSAALGQAGSSVAGPVGIVNYMQRTAENGGLTGIIFIIAILSLSLALLNTLPIPALDGGRLFVTLLFRVLKKPLSREREEKIHATGFLALMGLVVVITIVDINRLVG